MLEGVNAELYRRIVETQPLLFVVIDDAGTITYANQAAEVVLGVAPEEAVGRSVAEFVPTEDLELALGALGELVDRVTRAPYGPDVSGGSGVPLVLHLRRADGTLLTAEIGATARLEDPVVHGTILRIRPVEGQEWMDRALEALVASSPLEEVLEFLVASLDHELVAAETAVLWDLDDGRFRSAVSRDLPAVLTGVGAEPGPWTAALEADHLIDPPDLGGIGPTLRRAAADAGFVSCWAMPVHAGDGSADACIVVWRSLAGPAWVSQRVALARAAKLVALAFERRRSEERLRHAALHDSLTSLPNRLRFFGELDALAPPIEAVAAEPLVGVLYLDLDGFKPVNDTYGHAAGDELLRVVGERLDDVMRRGDLVARLGGDEFAVICHDLSSTDEAIAVAERILAEVTRPVDVGTHTVTVGVSIGIAVAPAGDQPGTALLDAADAALYAAKDAGKGRWVLSGT